MPDCYIFDAVRTPRGKLRDGALNTIPPIRLAVRVLEALRDRNQLDTAAVDDVVLGCVEPVDEQGSDIARVAAMVAGFDQRVPGVQINRFCASGLTATNMAAAAVMANQADMTIGGGVESMSRVPMGSSRGAWTHDPDVAASTRFVPQGISADLMATLFGHSRRDCDEVGVISQQRAAAAQAAGHFDRSIVPVFDQNGVLVLDTDEHPRPGTTLESLGKLRPAFAKLGQNYGYDAVAIQRYPQVERIEHVHHAGNSSGIVDGAAAILMGTREAGQRLGLKPRARIVGYADIGSEPTIMLTGPADAAAKALRRNGMSAADIDLWEINEAFASVVLRFEEVLGIDHERVNVNGGAIALGHPLGCSGARILTTLVHALRQRDQRYGVATLCVGVGQGVATVVESLSA
jgi:acetyl-CoA C-acetyltransferase